MLFVRICEYIATTIVFGAAVLTVAMLFVALIGAIAWLIALGGIWVIGLLVCTGLGMLVRFVRWYFFCP